MNIKRIKYENLKIGVLISSDRASKNLYEDLSGPAIKEIIEKYIKDPQFQYKVLPDEKKEIEEYLKFLVNKGCSLIFTSGGTGFGKRDIMPEVTEKIIKRKIPGIPEVIRSYSLQFTKHAMLSRATAGIVNNSIIINLPGSPKAIKEILDYILEPILHGLDMLNGEHD